MIYVILGEDEQKKQAKIAEIKKKILTKKDALNFDYQVIHGAGLDPKTLKEELFALAAIADERLVLLHGAEKLNPANRELLINFAALPSAPCCLILESADLTENDPFIKKLKPQAKVTVYSLGPAPNVFDMTRAISMRRPQQALMMLSDLLADGVHPLQIMGGIIWFWRKTRGRVASAKFEKGLEILQEADMNIKRSRWTPEYAVELVVVKLCALMT